MELDSPFLGLIQTQQSGIGGFVARQIRTLLFAQRPGVSLYVQDVVANLKGQADTLGVIVQVLQDSEPDPRIDR